MEMIVFEALSVTRLLYQDLERSEDVMMALSVLMMDEFKALSVLTETYMVLKGIENVTKALSVFMMEKDEFKAL